MSHLTGVVVGTTFATLLAADSIADVMLRTQYVKLVLDDSGSWQAFCDRTTERELLTDAGRQPFMSIQLHNHRVNASRVVLKDDVLQVAFGTQATAELSIREHPSHVTLELTSLSPESVEEITLADLLVKPTPDVSTMLNMAYDDHFATCIMALNLPVHCQLYRHAPDSGTLEGVTQTFHPGTGKAPVGEGYGEYNATSTRKTNDGWSVRYKRLHSPLDLSEYTGLGLWVRGDGKGQSLKVQLFDGLGKGVDSYKDHYILIDFEGWKYIELPRGEHDQLDYSHIVNINFYYNGLPGQQTVSCGLDDLRALKQLTGQPQIGPDTLVLEDFESPTCEYYDREGVQLTARCYAKYGLIGAKYALFGAPRTLLSQTIEKVEQSEGLPCPKLSGKWGRESPDIKHSYIMFHDLGEDNINQAIEYAKLANAAMVVFCQPSWAVSAGHFELRKDRFPNGLDGMKRCVEKIHAAGLRSGLHFLACGISNNDPYVSPVPDPRLLKDGQVILAEDIDQHTTVIPTTEAPGNSFPREDKGYDGTGVDVQIDQEIIHYGGITETGFLDCRRGMYGTAPAPHKQGATIHHLARHYGMFLRDVNSSLNDEVADRIAHIVNTCGFGMVYFDGSERLQGDHWYYNPKLQFAYWQRFAQRNNLLIQGSSYAHLSWHMHARQASADGYRDIKRLLDERSAWFEQSYRKNFMPLDLGWYGMGQPQLSFDDVEYVCCRSIGFDASIGWSTSIAALAHHPRGREMLELAGRYERLRLADTFDQETKARVQTKGQDYRLVQDDGRWRFIEVQYDNPVRVTDLDGQTNLWTITDDTQPPDKQLEVEINVGPVLQPGANWEREDNVVLEDFTTLVPYGASPDQGSSNLIIGTGKHGAVKEGVTQRFELTEEITRTGRPTAKYEAVSTLNSPDGWSAIGKHFETPVDLSWMAGIGLWVYGDGKGAQFKVQLRDATGGWNDHYIPLNYTGWRYHELVQPHSGQLDREHVEYLFFYFNGLPARTTSTIYLDTVKALRELSPPLRNICLSINDRPLTFPGEFETGQTILFQGMNTCRLLEGGQPPTPLTPEGTAPLLAPGENTFRLNVEGSLTRAVTVRTARVGR
ncbi:MAG: hypothetical protein ACUVX8_00620 [Candidatus Zipacnadales bacterium]